MEEYAESKAIYATACKEAAWRRKCPYDFQRGYGYLGEATPFLILLDIGFGFVSRCCSRTDPTLCL